MSNRKPAIVLQTDFGLYTGYPSAMYGVIRMVDSDLDVFDLNHNIKSFNIRAGSVSLKSYMPYWPEDTIFVSVIDPGVGTTRKSCVAKMKDGKYLVTPDNGTLTTIIDMVEEVREIDESINRLPGSEESSTFHGRDVYAYVAARLASGVICYEQVGPSYNVSDCVLLEKLAEPVIEGNKLYCVLEDYDAHFGSIAFNLLRKDFEDFGPKFGDTVNVKITLKDEVVFDENVPYFRTFGYVNKNELLLLASSDVIDQQINLCINERHFVRRYLPDVIDDPALFYEYRVIIEK